jgi:hypothetical protein
MWHPPHIPSVATALGQTLAAKGVRLSKVQSADKPAKDATELGVSIHNQFETILRSACADYNKNKITVRRSRLAGTAEEEKVTHNTGHQAYVRLVPKSSEK